MLRRLIGLLKHKGATESYLNTLDEAFVRKAFFGLFGKSPFHPTDGKCRA